MGGFTEFLKDSRLSHNHSCLAIAHMAFNIDVEGTVYFLCLQLDYLLAASLNPSLEKSGSTKILLNPLIYLHGASYCEFKWLSYLLKSTLSIKVLFHFLPVFNLSFFSPPFCCRK